MEARIVRSGELHPCKTAFIDAHTPGSNRKENFTIIGGGVSESPDQHVHIALPQGFNVGAAGQPPHCRNSPHSHRTAEVFFVLSGRWRFFRGRHGEAGEVMPEQGDIIDIPTGIFHGSENVGTDYGTIMAILGGDGAGGGVIWAPQVIEDAADHGLLPAGTGKLHDTRQGQSLPGGVPPMKVLTDVEFADHPELAASDVVGFGLRRYRDTVAMAGRNPARIIGAPGMIRDRPGFDLIARSSATETMHRHDRASVLIPVRGHWRVVWGGGEESGATVPAPGDTRSVPADLDHATFPSMTDESALYNVVATDDVAGFMRRP